MKKIFALILISILFVCGGFIYRANQEMTAIMQELGIDPAEGRTVIFTNFKHQLLDGPGIQYSTDELRAMATGKKAVWVKMLGDYIKRYTQSPEFIRSFNMMVNPPKRELNSTDDLQQMLIDGTKKDLSASETLMTTSKGEDKIFHQESIAIYKQELEKQQKPLETPNSNDAFKNTEKFINDFLKFGDQTKGMGAMLVKEDEQYRGPTTINALVKLRLQQFLDFTADIDFNAKLVEEDGVKKFADPVLERKSHNWKRCFRAGKETIEAARQYAAAWLKELGN